jgi:uncharacterized iron-regulated membrane protein
MKTSLSSRLHRWHKRFGLALAVVTILWGLSGIAHPIMSRIKPMAQAQLPLKPININDLSGIAPILGKIEAANDLLIINRYNSNPVVAVQAQDKTEWRYFDARTGQEVGDFKSQYLPLIASLYAGVEEALVDSITIVDNFSYDYPMINRFLPAYKIKFKDDLATTVYIDAQTLKPASVSNKYKAFYTQWFSHLHSWDFIPNTTFRYGLMFLVTVLLFLSALLGIYLTLHRWRKGILHKGNKTRRAHRYIGLFVCLAALAFSFSGGFHAFNKLTGVSHASKNQISNSQHSAESSTAKLINHTSDFAELWSAYIKQGWSNDVNQIQFIWVNDQPVLQMHHLTEAPHRPGMHQHGAHKRLIRGDISYFPEKLTVDAQDKPTQSVYLQQLLHKYSPNENVKESRLQPHFNHEYGFIDKKLPTYRVQTDDSLYFFDPTAQTLSKSVSKQQLIESWSFSTLHKAGFLDGLGKDIRDILIVIFVLGIILITVLGLTLSLKRRG